MFSLRFRGSPMIVMKFGGASVQDAQAIDRAAAIVRERLQRKIFSSPQFRPTTRQVSGHEFTRATKNCFSQTSRHPELPSMRTRSHQRPNRGEGPCVSSNSSRLPKQKVPRVCSQADESACSLTTLGMTIRFLRASAPPRCQRSSRRVLP